MDRRGIYYYWLAAVVACSQVWPCLSADDPLQVFDGVWVSITPPGPHVVFNRIGGQTRLASLPILGQATITASNGENGSNFKVSGEGFSCFYLVLTTNQRSRMVWELKSGQSVCMQSAVLERADDTAADNAPKATSPQNSTSPPVVRPKARVEPTLLAMIASGRWCTERRSYWLKLNDRSIVWKDSFGSTDIEEVIYDSATEAKTKTQRSSHSDGDNVPIGTTWVYYSNGTSTINVAKNGVKRTFSLNRC
jgi:hypothetical protein